MANQKLITGTVKLNINNEEVMRENYSDGTFKDFPLEGYIAPLYNEEIEFSQRTYEDRVARGRTKIPYGT